MALTRHQIFVWLAHNMEGTQEVGGPNQGRMVEKFQRAVDGKASKEAYCTGFQVFLCDEVDALFKDGIKHQLPRTEWSLGMWNAAPVRIKIQRPIPGSVMLWRHENTQQGHAGTVKEVMEELHQCRTTEGNTGAGAGVVREGDGVWERVRSWAGEGDMKVLGWLNPWPDNA